MAKKGDIVEILEKFDADFLISTPDGDYVLMPLEDYLSLKHSQNSPKNLTEPSDVDRINRDIAHVSLDELEQYSDVKWPEKEQAYYVEPIDEEKED